MQTPFQKIRRRQKERKQRINLSLSPNQQNFSIQTSPRATLHGSLRRVKHHSTKIKPDRKKASERVAGLGQYQLVVRDSLRKTSNHRFATPNGKSEENTSPLEQSGRLAIEGLRCGDDLIKQNRGKLEHMIAQIQANDTVLHLDKPLQEICMEKYRAIRSRLEKDQHTRIDHRMQSGTLTKKDKFDTREFLICQPAPRDIDTAPIPKTVRRTSNSSHKMNLTYKQSQPVFNFIPERFYIQSPRRRSSTKYCKTQQQPKSPSPNPRKGPVLNGFPPELKGWESHPQPPSFFSGPSDIFYP